MTNYIIECKNKTSLLEDAVEPFGEFSTTIQDKIVLEENDQILLKSVFVDTQASSNQKINIPNPLECEITFIRYRMNNNSIEQMTHDGLANVLDGRLYLETNQVATPADVRVMTNFRLEPNDLTNKSFGNFTFFLNYTNHEGQVVNERHFIPPQTVNPILPKNSFFIVPSHVDFKTTQPFTITVGTSTGQNLATSANPGFRGVFNNTKLAEPAGPAPPGAVTDFPTGYSEAATNTTLITPKSTFKFTIQSGNYDPHDLVEVINDQLSAVGTDNLSISNLTDNPFLKSVPLSVGDKTIFVCPQSTVNLEENTPAFTKLDYRYAIDVNDSTPNAPQYTAYYLGTSQINLSFQDDTQTFEWEYNHFPFFKTNAEAVGYFTATNNDVSFSTFISQINRLGGVLFTNLTAFDTKTNRPSNFWTEILGFNLNLKEPEKCLLVQYASELNLVTPLAGTKQVFKPVFDPQPKLGVNFTAGFSGLDSAVQKGDLTKQNAFPFIPKLGGETDEAGFLLSSVTKTSPIQAGQNILTQTSNFGYYLIEVSSNFSTNFINENQTKKNVMGIVSKYYVKDSYTSAGEEASLIYQHQGEPMLLSSFDIRILDSDRNLAAGIGRDNTVIIQIVKAPKLNKK